MSLFFSVISAISAAKLDSLPFPQEGEKMKVDGKLFEAGEGDADPRRKTR